MKYEDQYRSFRKILNDIRPGDWDRLLKALKELDLAQWQGWLHQRLHYRDGIWPPNPIVGEQPLDLFVEIGEKVSYETQRLLCRAIAACLKEEAQTTSWEDAPLSDLCYLVRPLEAGEATEALYALLHTERLPATRGETPYTDEPRFQALNSMAMLATHEESRLPRVDWEAEMQKDPIHYVAPCFVGLWNQSEKNGKLQQAVELLQGAKLEHEHVKASIIPLWSDFSPEVDLFTIRGDAYVSVDKRLGPEIITDQNSTFLDIGLAA